MLHILFITHSISLYGATRSVLDLASGLQRLGQKIFFFIPYEGRIEERHMLKQLLNDMEIPCAFLRYYPSVHSMQEKGLSPRVFRMKENKKCLQKMEEYIKLWEIDIIHTNCFTHTIGAGLAQQAKKPHVWHIREALKKDYAMAYDSKLLYKYALMKTEQVICISGYVRKTHKKMLCSARVKVLHNGFDINHYILNGAFQKEPEVFTLIICGSIREEKGQLDAVKAMDILVHHYQIKNIALKIIGSGTGEYIDQIKNCIKSKELESHIEILPFHLDLRNIRRNADIALMCSKNEALGRVTIESMLSENIVIGTNSAGTAEIIEDGVNGYLYEVGDIQELSKKIYDAVTHWDEQEEIVKRAKKFAKEKYDIGRYARKIFHTYMDIVESR